MPRLAKKKMINVNLAQLAKPLQVSKVEVGTTLGNFLKEQGIQYNAKVRVNAEAEKEGYKLKADDIITVIGEVSGG